jgi:hypothetical protein
MWSDKSQQWFPCTSRNPVIPRFCHWLCPRLAHSLKSLCDIEWRRHVAMPNDYGPIQFYRLIARRLGQPTKFSDQLAYAYRINRLKCWAIKCRGDGLQGDAVRSRGRS